MSNENSNLKLIEKYSKNFVKIYNSMSQNNNVKTTYVEETVFFGNNESDVALTSVNNKAYELELLYENFMSDLELYDEIILVGIANFEFLKRTVNGSNKLFHIVDMYDVYKKLIENKNFGEINLKRISSYTLLNENFNMDSILDKIRKDSNLKIKIVILPQYRRLFEEQTNDFYDKFQAVLKSKRSEIHTNLAYERRWTINSLLNYDCIYRTNNVFELKSNNYKNSIAIIVSAGPSLDFEIENLKNSEIRKKVYLFAVGSAYKSLLNNGVEPDYIITYDPSHLNQNVLDLYHEKNSQIPLIFSSTTGFESMKNYANDNGYHFYLSQDNVSKYIFEDYSNEEVINDAPSVASIAIQILSKIGFQNIGFIGQNLAYLNGFNYAKDIVHSHFSDGDKNSNLYCDSVDGEKLVTNEGLNIVRINLEQYINLYSSINFLNFTIKGAKINGTTFEDFKNYISENDFIKEDYIIKNKEKLNMISYNLRKFNDLRKEYLDLSIELKIYLENMELDFQKTNYKSLAISNEKFWSLLKKIDEHIYCKEILVPMSKTYYGILKNDLLKIKVEEDVLLQSNYIRSKLSALLNLFNENDNIIMSLIVKLERKE